MSQNITVASRQWASRPDDQRYLSLDELQNAVESRRENSWTVIPETKKMEIAVIDDGIYLEAYDPTVGEAKLLEPSNWSFNQLCQYGKAPASYLRSLPAGLAAANLEYGLKFNPLREDALALCYSNGGNQLRALTSTSYGRIWDSQVVQAVRQANVDNRWEIPAASYATRNPKRATTLYASDRDVFIFLVDPKNPVEVNGEQLFRGFYCWNSEVGSATFGLCTFLYRYVCDNRIVWGASDVRELRIRHTGGAPERFGYEGAKFLERYANESTGKLVEGIKSAQQKAIPTGKDESVQEWLQRHGFTKGVAKAAVDAAVAEEGQAVTIWDAVQGVTAYARSIVHTDERIALETAAGKLMALAV